MKPILKREKTGEWERKKRGGDESKEANSIGMNFCLFSLCIFGYPGTSIVDSASAGLMVCAINGSCPAGIEFYTL